MTTAPTLAGAPPPGITPCAACGNLATKPLHRVRGFDVVRCAECGLPRTVLPEGFDPTSLYDASYFQGGQRDGYADYVGSESALREEFRGTVERLGRAGATGGALLEVGSAYGFFLDEASRCFRVSGVEVAADARAACRDRDHEVVAEATESWLGERGPFDAIVLLDVIEHLSDPAQLLARLRPHLKPSGRLLLTTGDASSLYARAAGSRWRLMTPPQHLWFFDPKSLGALFERTGYALESVEHPWKRVPLSLVAYTGLRLVGLRAPGWLRSLGGSVPINLFDAMRVVARPR